MLEVFSVFLYVESVFSVFGCFRGVFPTSPRFFPVIFPSDLLINASINPFSATFNSF